MFVILTLSLCLSLSPFSTPYTGYECYRKGEGLWRLRSVTKDGTSSNLWVQENTFLRKYPSNSTKQTNKQTKVNVGSLGFIMFKSKTTEPFPVITEDLEGTSIGSKLIKTKYIHFSLRTCTVFIFLTFIFRRRWESGIHWQELSRNI